MSFLTGIIDNNGHRVFFSSEEGSYNFCFMSGGISDTGVSNSYFRLHGENGFIYGKTNLGRQIGIFTGDYPLDVFESNGYKTAAYAVSRGMEIDDEDFKYYDGISFQGGTLSKIYTPKGLKVLPPGDMSGYVAKEQKDRKSYRIQVNNLQIEIEIYSVIKYSQHPTSVENTEVFLNLIFSTPQPFYTFVEHYHVIRELLAFMTFRKNVVFDSIQLLKHSELVKSPIPSADLFIRTESVLTSKEPFRCISVEKLDSYFPELLKWFYVQNYQRGQKKRNKKNTNSLPSLGFIPEDDRDSTRMTNAKLREICSAVEHEIHNTPDLNIRKNAVIVELISELNSTINDFKKLHPELSDDEYSALSSKFSNWSLPLREELFALCQKYSSYISNMANSRYGFTEYSLRREDIKEFVDYRNQTTHGSGAFLELNIIRTSYLLAGVVCCSILSRIGVSADRINEFCANGMIL